LGARRSGTLVRPGAMAKAKAKKAAEKAPDPADPAPAEDEGDENLVFVSEKLLQEVERKVKAGSDIEAKDLEDLASPRKVADEEIVVPVDLRGLDKAFGDEEDIVDEEMAIDIPRIIRKLGAKAAAEAFVAARECFERNAAKQPEEDRPERMTAKAWKAMVDEGSDLAGLDLGEGEGGESEDDLEDEEECELDGDLEWDEEPATKKQKTTQ